MRLFENHPAASKGERGAVILLTAAAISLILAIAAISIDLSATRSDRSGNQISADSAAAAGAVSMADGTAVDGCAAAAGYLDFYYDGTAAGLDCTAMPSSCDASTSAVTTSATSGTTTVSITSPIPDAHMLMGSSTVGLPVVATTDPDGDGCDRIGVLVTEVRGTFFASALGFDTATTTVHAVALAGVDKGQVTNINLLLLNKTRCGTISVNGGGSSGGVTVLPVVNPTTGDIHPGSVAIDSDASDCGGTGSISINGGHAQVRADGAPGCPGELVSGTGQGCGVIEAFSGSASDCNSPSCAPTAGTSSSRVTRAQLDYRWNCKSVYPTSYDINGCPDTGSRSSYIDDLVSSVGSMGVPSGFLRYSLLYPCNVGGGPSTNVTVLPGNWVVDCDLRVARPLTFLGGNIIFNGDVDVTANGVLRINELNPSSYNWSPGSTVDRSQSSAGAAYVYFRDGSFSKAGGGSIYMNNTFTYLSETSEISMTGGGGDISLVAPTEGPFKDLALWSESSSEQKFAGGATVTLEGVFFAPNASVRFQGNGSQTQVAAQFIADKLTTGGNGSLTLAPLWERSVQFPQSGDSQLIR